MADAATPSGGPLLVADAVDDPGLGCPVLPDGEAYEWAFTTRQSNLSNARRVFQAARKHGYAAVFEDLTAPGFLPEGVDPKLAPPGFEVMGKRLHSRPPGYRTVAQVYAALNELARFAAKTFGPSHRHAQSGKYVLAAAIAAHRRHGPKIRRCDDAERPHCAACGTFRAWDTNQVMACTKCPLHLHMRCHGLPPGADLRTTFVCNACSGRPSELDGVFRLAEERDLAEAAAPVAAEPLPASGRSRRRAAVAAQHAVTKAVTSERAPAFEDEEEELEGLEEDEIEDEEEVAAAAGGSARSASARRSRAPASGARTPRDRGRGGGWADDSSMADDDADDASSTDGGDASARRGRASSKTAPASASAPAGRPRDASPAGSLRAEKAEFDRSSGFPAWTAGPLHELDAMRAAVAAAQPPVEALLRLCTAWSDGRTIAGPAAAALCASDPVRLALAATEHEQSPFNRFMRACVLLPAADFRAALAADANPSRAPDWPGVDAVPVPAGTLTVDEFQQLDGQRARELVDTLLEAERLVLTRSRDGRVLARPDAKLAADGTPPEARAVPDEDGALPFCPRTASAAVDAAWCRAVAARPALLIEEAWARVRAGESALTAISGRGHAASAPPRVRVPPEFSTLPAHFLPLAMAASNPACALDPSPGRSFVPEEDAGLAVAYQEAAAASVAFHCVTGSHTWAMYRAGILCRRFRVRACRRRTAAAARERSKVLAKLIREAGASGELDFRCAKVLDVVSVLHGEPSADTVRRQLDCGLFGLPWSNLERASSPPRDRYLGPSNVKSQDGAIVPVLKTIASRAANKLVLAAAADGSSAVARANADAAAATSAATDPPPMADGQPQSIEGAAAEAARQGPTTSSSSSSFSSRSRRRAGRQSPRQAESPSVPATPAVSMTEGVASMHEDVMI
ncbi:hypothetical protein FNF27_04507 [Cafeteria roenbergensis]|uniref:Phorbol-ester/DAG-type domain-containing protein n=1 Tax=Cafeteria roenbergensis TaxID=33653 RepID=A0A5A8E878_CAFRO|nr:hypothetical protein FNF27_04507 [Cafeteria roenbergensis]